MTSALDTAQGGKREETSPEKQRKSDVPSDTNGEESSARRMEGLDTVQSFKPEEKLNRTEK